MANANVSERSAEPAPPAGSRWKRGLLAFLAAIAIQILCTSYELKADFDCGPRLGEDWLVSFPVFPNFSRFEPRFNIRGTELCNPGSEEIKHLDITTYRLFGFDAYVHSVDRGITRR
jgi:hypothetical protein